MLDFSWKVFSKTGSIDTYLLMKELERDLNDTVDDEMEDEYNRIDAH
ncbi:YqzL family protein [Bacillus alkalicellulosilyticus]|nr:YqzL family protein [Bacillus alkalicellulosilyticus]